MQCNEHLVARNTTQFGLADHFFDGPRTIVLHYNLTFRDSQEWRTLGQLEQELRT